MDHIFVQFRISVWVLYGNHRLGMRTFFVRLNRMLKKISLHSQSLLHLWKEPCILGGNCFCKHVAWSNPVHKIWNAITRRHLQPKEIADCSSSQQGQVEKECRLLAQADQKGSGGEFREQLPDVK